MKKALLGITYWIIQLTWGILMNIIGLVATLFCLICLKGKIHRNGYGFITEVWHGWGGVSLGAFSLCCKCSKPEYQDYDPAFYEDCRRHEFGHSIQNMIFGPLFLIVIGIPSFIRYWLDEYNKLKKDYMDIWFERTATSWGTKWINWLEDK